MVYVITSNHYALQLVNTLQKFVIVPHYASPGINVYLSHCD